MAITDESGAVTDRFSYDTYGKLISRTGVAETPFLYNGRDGVMTDANGLFYMRARYYNPDLKRFVNADILKGEIANSATLNRYAYANGNPVSNVDPFGLAVERGTKYDRDAAVSYAKKYAFGYNLEDYVAFDDLIFSLMYLFNYGAWTGNADCANFVSQCLEAGGIDMNSDWHFYINTNEATALPGVSSIKYKNSSGILSDNPIEYDFTSAWSSANAQYKYFSDKKNIYTNEKVIKVDSFKDIKQVVSDYNIQKGDLLYWSDDNGKTAHHATIISEVTNNDILFAGHTQARLDKSVKETMKDNKETIIIVRLNDYFKEN